jgi:hypothetical protein
MDRPKLSRPCKSFLDAGMASFQLKTFIVSSQHECGCFLCKRMGRRGNLCRLRKGNSAFALRNCHLLVVPLHIPDPSGRNRHASSSFAKHSCISNELVARSDTHSVNPTIFSVCSGRTRLFAGLGNGKATSDPVAESLSTGDHQEAHKRDFARQ